MFRQKVSYVDRQVTISELAKFINGGVDVDRMIVDVAGTKCDVKKRRRVVVVRGEPVYQENNRNIGRIMRGDILYIHNGDTVEVV